MERIIYADDKFKRWRTQFWDMVLHKKTDLQQDDAFKSVTYILNLRPPGKTHKHYFAVIILNLFYSNSFRSSGELRIFKKCEKLGA